MNIDGKRILVFGLGISGLSAIKALSRYNCYITLLDSQSKDSLLKELEELKDIEVDYRLGGDKADLDNIDLIIKSPGIPPNNKFLIEARNRGVEIVTDLEFAYRLSSFDKTITITGTNGKTTTTSLVSEIVNKSYKNVNVIGNIGAGILDTVLNSKEDSVNILEASSFQLNDTSSFRSKIFVIINISPDHLDWHGNYENYILAKIKSLKNQKPTDIAILNYEDENIRKNIKDVKSRIVWFSTERELDEGIFIKDGDIFIKDGKDKFKILSVSETNLILENLLATIGATYYFGIDIEDIKDGILSFNSLEHRMEYVDEINGIKFINDSKGTNPESTIKAIESIGNDIILIGGGYDKGSDFSLLSESLVDRVNYLILMGETRDKMKISAEMVGFKNILIVDDMEEAINLAWEKAEKGNNILLSPACASWGMYKNFEERGTDFKEKIRKLKVENKYDEKKENR